jgi:GT2 family glycosyltransferase
LWPGFDVEPPRELHPVIFQLGGFNRYGELRRLDVFIGANCAFPRRVLDRVGLFDEDFGPGGRVVPWGDDTQWQRRAAALGFPLEHDDALAVRHRVQANRISVEAVLTRAERVGRTLARVQWGERRPGLAVLLRQRTLARWAALKARGIEGRCLARRLAGYAAEVATLRR